VNESNLLRLIHYYVPAVGLEYTALIWNVQTILSSRLSMSCVVEKVNTVSVTTEKIPLVSIASHVRCKSLPQDKTAFRVAR